MNFEYNIAEATRVLSSCGLDEVQKALSLKDDDIVDIILDRSGRWENKILEWYLEYQRDSKLEYCESNSHK